MNLTNPQFTSKCLRRVWKKFTELKNIDWSKKYDLRSMRNNNAVVKINYYYPRPLLILSVTA